VNRVPSARFFAEPAARALTRVNDTYAEEVVGVLGELKAERVEGADVDAELAARADAFIFDDDGFWPVLLLQRDADFAEVVHDRFGRTNSATGPAVDAQRCVDDMQLVALAGDCVRWATLGAGGTPNACLDDAVGQVVSPGSTFVVAS